MLMILIIGTFVYTYFFYLKGDVPSRNKENEVETGNITQNTPMNDPNPVTVAGQNVQNNPWNMQEGDQFSNQQNRQNPVNAQEGDQFFNQQNKQNPLAMREHNPFGMRNGRKGFNNQMNQQAQLQNPDGVPQAAAIQAYPGRAQQCPVNQNSALLAMLNQVSNNQSYCEYCKHSVFSVPQGQAVANLTPIQRAVPVPDKVLQEGHWIGFEVIPLTPAIAKANKIPSDISGVLVDEVTLVSAEVGLLAGDVITAIQGKAVKDLKSFKEATRPVAQSKQATLTIYRGGKYTDIFINSTEELGIAQMEAAPMILATSRAPHGYYGPCDRCHLIAKSRLNVNELAKDMGDSLTKIAPNIRRGTPPPHRNRGTCSTCHVIL